MPRKLIEKRFSDLNTGRQASVLDVSDHQTARHFVREVDFKPKVSEGQDRVTVTHYMRIHSPFPASRGCDQLHVAS